MKKILFCLVLFGCKTPEPKPPPLPPPPPPCITEPPPPAPSINFKGVKEGSEFIECLDKENSVKMVSYLRATQQWADEIWLRCGKSK